MKTYTSSFISSLITGLVIFITSCDKAPNDVRNLSSINGLTDRKVLIEDYTGHSCGNCPAAADELEKIAKKYPNNIVALAVHAGYFTKVKTDQPTNLTCAAGNAYDDKFENSSAGNPNGLVSRIDFPKGSQAHIKKWPNWQADAITLMKKPAEFLLKITKSIDTTNSTLTIDATIDVTSKGFNSSSYKVVALLSENKIVAEQLDYRLPSSNQINPDYVFQHVLRANVSDIWGVPVFPGGSAVNELSKITIPTFKVDLKSTIPNIKPLNCYLICFIYDAKTSSTKHMEILQAEEVKLY